MSIGCDWDSSNSGCSHLKNPSRRDSRIVFTPKTEVLEVGLENLTKEEAPVLVHFGADQTD
jgi:hypothetical protein